MSIDRIPDPTSAGLNTDLLRRSSEPEDAARAFEEVLVEQFVSTMTDQLFKTSLSGDEGPGWMKAYGDTQRSMLTDILTDHLVDQKTFGLSQLLLDKWAQNGQIPDTPPDTAPATPGD